MTLYASPVLKQSDDNSDAGKYDPGHGESVSHGQIKDLVGLLRKSIREDVYAVFMALVGSLDCDKEKMWDAEAHGHRPAPGQQTPHQTQAVQLHRRSSAFQGPYQLLVPVSADEESGEDAAGFGEVGTEPEHAAEGFPEEPPAGKVCDGVGQVHQVVGDEVGHGQVDEEDLVGADAGFLTGQGAYGQPVVSQDPC